MPSGPVVIAPSPALGVGTGISVSSPLSVILPILFPLSSVNHIAPSGPTQIALGPEDGVSANCTTGDVVLTLRVVEPLIDPEVAEIAVCPTEALLARPALAIIATDGLEELQVAVFVTS